MPKIRYDDIKFNTQALIMIRHIDRICTQYQTDGYDMTLRQVYYVLVAQDLFPEDRKYLRRGNGKWVRDPNGTKNAEPNYKWLGKLVSDARMAGMLDWDHIIDRTRNLRKLPHYNNHQDFFDRIADQFNHDLWKDQPYYVEGWIEKDALAGVLQRACNALDVPWFSCRGYTSSSEVWGAAQRLRKKIEQGKKVVIIHLGDHDPSGVDMTRDIRERLRHFIATDFFQGRGTLKLPRNEAIALSRSHLEIRRIALNMDQVMEWNPPPNPTKFKDPRAKGYVERYGDESWELDALTPDTLVGLITEEVVSLRDEEKWVAALAREEADRKVVKLVAKRWPDIDKFLKWKPKRKGA